MFCVLSIEVNIESEGCAWHLYLLHELIETTFHGMRKRNSGMSSSPPSSPSTYPRQVRTTGLHSYRIPSTAETKNRHYTAAAKSRHQFYYLRYLTYLPNLPNIPT